MRAPERIRMETQAPEQSPERGGGDPLRSRGVAVLVSIGPPPRYKNNR